VSEATTEIDEVTPFVEDDQEIAYRSEAAPQVSQGPSGRPAVVAPTGATGRRKEAVARVRLATVVGSPVRPGPCGSAWPGR
jgi:small subunit ribosomal protein S9